MFYQMNLFEDFDIETIHYCKNCEFYQTRSVDMGYCHIARCFVTLHSFDWLCAHNHNGYSQYRRKKYD